MYFSGAMKSLQHPTIFLEEKIHRKNNQLLIKFEYDETLISLVRTVNGASWSKSLKAWYLISTAENLSMILKKLIPFQPFHKKKVKIKIR